MTKVLILAYDFPPYVSVGGLRPYGWFKYLHKYDVYPIVVTRQWSNQYGNYLDYIAPGKSNADIIEETSQGKIIKTPYRPNLANRLMLKYGKSKYVLLRKSISAFYEFTQFLILVGPKSHIFKSADAYLSCNPVDVIIATGDPFVLFSYAKKLSYKYSTPWIADYRDPWSQKTDIQSNLLLKKWHMLFEKKIVSNAGCVTTVSEFLKSHIFSSVKHPNIQIIKNGYDPDSIEEVKNIEQRNDILGFAVAGSIYDWHPLKKVLSIFSDFLKLEYSEKFQINFYGITIYSKHINLNITELISSEFPELIGFVEIHSKLPNELLLKELARQNVMLLFNDYSILGTKIFDYLGVNRNILFCFENDAESELLRSEYFTLQESKSLNQKLQIEAIHETNSGYVIRDGVHLLEKLKELHLEFKQYGFIKSYAISTDQYSRKHQVEQLATLIKTISLQKN